ncbi:unnamed protein product [Larinioides sclopetarius]|uniref:Uncharacterized protein n=1 Tax=Larinioides sclopetarius TaxID=280406 RepID=A0AAV1Z5F3_9ARAC
MTELRTSSNCRRSVQISRSCTLDLIPSGLHRDL